MRLPGAEHGMAVAPLIPFRTRRGERAPRKSMGEVTTPLYTEDSLCAGMAL